jgi:hypothetical protein
MNDVRNGHCRRCVRVVLLDRVAGEGLTCVECGSTADDDAHGWRAYLVDLKDDGEPLEVVFLCPDCAGRAFGGS